MKKIQNLLMLLFISIVTPTLGQDIYEFGYYDDYNPKWEIGVDFGISMFIGTLNFNSKNLLNMYRTDGNDLGYSFQGFITRKINHCLYLTFEGGSTFLTGEITDYRKSIASENVQIYNTNNLYGGMLLCVDILNLKESDEYVYKEWRLLLKCGIGLTKSNIITIPFEQEQIKYNLSDNKSIEFAIPFGVKVLFPIAFNASCYTNLNFVAVKGYRLDGYHSLATSNTCTKKPLSHSVDLFSTLTFGICFNW